MKRCSLYIIIIVVLIIKGPHLLAKEMVEYQYLIEEQVVEEFIIGSVDDIHITKKENTIFIRKDEFWEKTIFDEENIKIIKFNDNYLISSLWNKKIKIRILDNNGRFLYEELLDENPVENYDCKFYNGYFYFTGCVEQYTSKKFIEAKGNKPLDKYDTFLIKAKQDFSQIQVQVFGGYLNESFERLIINHEGLIVVGSKDQTTGGDFGNGGRFIENNLIIAKFTFNLQLIGFNIINTNYPLVNVHLYNDLVYIITENECLVIDQNLQFRKSIAITNIKYSYLGNEMLALFTNNEIIVCSLNNLNIESRSFYNEEFDNVVNIIAHCDTISVFLNRENILYCQIIDILRIKKSPSSCVLDYCLLPNQSMIVNTLFNNAQLVQTISYPYFNRNIHGNYEFILTFLIRENKEINITSSLQVSLECNVSDGGIYPLGYRLKFTGNASLNDQEIFNNYPLDKEGSYELVLSDCLGQTTRYNFTVDKEQFYFEELIYKSWDMTVFKDSTFFIQINLSKERHENLEKIKFNKDYLRTHYDFENEVLTVYFNSPELNGVYVYYFYGLEFTDDVLELNYLYIVNVLKKPPMAEIIPKNNNTLYYCQFEDSDNTLRYLEIKIIQNQKENIYRYSLGNNLLVISNINRHNILDIEIAFLYDLGDNLLREIKILDLTVLPRKDKITLGHLDFVKSSQYIEGVNLGVCHRDKDFEIKSLQYNNIDLSFKQKTNKYWIIIAFFLGISIFSITRIIKIKKKKQS